MNWYLKVIKDNYANFSGRARRQEFWMFFLIQVGIFLGVIFIFSAMEEFFGIKADAGGTVLLIYMAATFIPWLALNVRRLHDTNKSGFYLLINLIPIIGRIWYIILVASEGDSGTNQYGPDPKGNFEDEIDEIGKPLLDE